MKKTKKTSEQIRKEIEDAYAKIVAKKQALDIADRVATLRAYVGRVWRFDQRDETIYACVTSICERQGWLQGWSISIRQGYYRFEHFDTTSTIANGSIEISRSDFDKVVEEFKNFILHLDFEPTDPDARRAVRSTRMHEAKK